ncbi:PD40 domain-containing protein [candidate division WOR-3 bacterium]|nr:PD40 domain-containing protein [candidate division WOR-3 bacterium]
MIKMRTFLEGLLISVVITAIVATSPRCGRDNYGDIDTLPRFTQHCWGPTWSPDGQTIAFGYVPWITVEGDTFVEKWDSSGVFLIDADGTNKRPFQMAGIAPFLSFPDFNPDGEWLVYIGGPGGVNNIYKAKINGDSITQLTFNNYWNRRPKWSPDGKKILFGRTEAPSDSCGLCLMDADGLNNKVINRENSAEIGDFLPDYEIAFLGWVNNSAGIWITDTIGSNKIRIYEYGDHAGGISCSPDGSKILFCIDDTEKLRLEIWVIDVDGSNPKRLCIDGIEPCWSPDGTKIVYVKYNSTKQAMTHPGYGELWVMDADGSNQRQLTFVD